MSRRINRKQSLLPEHYLPVIFDVDGTAEGSSGRLSSSIASLWTIQRQLVCLPASLFVHQRGIASHPMHFFLTHSIHSRRKTIFTTSKRKVILKYTGWRFKWFLGLAKVAIGSFHAPFERVYSLYFMQMATIHTWTHWLFHFKSLHIIYICIIACYRQSS